MTARLSGQIEQRDIDIILDALRYGAMCNEQLLAYSQSFGQPFPEESKIRRRASVLRQLGFINTRSYATGALRGRSYHTLTAKGYRRRFHADPPQEIIRLFHKVPENNQAHHFAMMHFYVKTIVACRQRGFAFRHYLPENTQPVSVYGRMRDHDGRFRIVLPGFFDFGFIAEVDNHTETLQSDSPAARTVADWMRTYLHCDLRTKRKEQVLLVSTKGGPRLDNLVGLAARLNPNPDRQLFVGIDLPAYLAAEDPLTGSYCLDQRGRRSPLLWYTDRRLRLLQALKSGPLTLKQILRRSRRSLRPFTCPATIRDDLRFLYERNCVSFRCWNCDGCNVFEFFPTAFGIEKISL